MYFLNLGVKGLRPLAGQFAGVREKQHHPGAGEEEFGRHDLEKTAESVANAADGAQFEVCRCVVIAVQTLPTTSMGRCG